MLQLAFTFPYHFFLVYHTNLILTDWRCANRCPSTISPPYQWNDSRNQCRPFRNILYQSYITLFHVLNKNFKLSQVVLFVRLVTIYALFTEQYEGLNHSHVSLWRWNQPYIFLWLHMYECLHPLILMSLNEVI